MHATPQESEPKKATEQQEKNTEEQTESNEENEASEEEKSPLIYVEKFPRSEIDIAPPTDELTHKENDIKHYLPTELIQPLMVGDKTVSTLIDTNNAPNSKGVMILLPDWNQSVANPQVFTSLRKTFPDEGWTTISVLPPKKPENYPSYALKKEDRTKEDKKTLTDYQKGLAMLVNAATEKAKNYPGIIIVVAAGHNASLLLNIFSNEEAELPAALVLVGAYMNETTSNTESAVNLSQLDLPVLDLLLKTDSSGLKESATLRRKMVNQELKSNYRQVEIFNIHTGYYPKHALVTSINGWLKSIGW